MRAYIIAEIGVNHGGDPCLAYALIDEAARAGADAVKLQTFRPTELSVAGTHQDMLTLLDLSLDYYPRLIERARHWGMEFLSSPFDIESARALVGLGLTRLKVPSGELTNLPFLEELRTLGARLIVSTGMANLHECKVAHDILGDLVDCWLHCVSVYPAPIEGYNLRAMSTLFKLTKQDAGLSDHTIGDHLAIAAAAMGARVIEKHITTYQPPDGPDHVTSMNPYQFAEMVRKIRDIESAIGTGVKLPTPQELNTMPIARRVATSEGFKRQP